MKGITLSAEQELFISKVLAGNNVLVDACIGSGKTTTIQELCNRLPSNKKILYLTYNKLLKIDAKEKITNRNATVTNYHGLAFTELKRMNIVCGISDLIQTFNRIKPKLTYQVLIIDEYQDIEQELAEMLEVIKANNPNLQIAAVGDMMQKIYDKTTLDVPQFMDKFLGKHEKVEFTQCFRLNREHAARLGMLWEKQINGVNDNCHILYMSPKQAQSFLEKQNPSEVLCLGARTGQMSQTLNYLEKTCPEKYNKHTIYASISDKNSDGGAVSPRADSGIFTTFDSSKGLERKICVVFDWTSAYWMSRLRQPQQSYQILKNIFLVAASRGKETIIFVDDYAYSKRDQTKQPDKDDTSLLSDEMILKRPDGKTMFKDMDISDMFSFKYKEDVEHCYKLLSVKKILTVDTTEIKVVNKDGLIDLSPCIGIHQEATFFKGYDIDKQLALAQGILNASVTVLDEREGVSTTEEKPKKGKRKKVDPEQTVTVKADTEVKSLEEKILELVHLQTHLERYKTQVTLPFIDQNCDYLIRDRLATVFSPTEQVQQYAEIPFFSRHGTALFVAKGYCDVIKDDTVYELKFVADLQHEHFLQCASYMIGLELKKGILWNTRDNTMYEITIPDEKALLNAMATTVTKGYLNRYYDGTSQGSVKEKPSCKPVLADSHPLVDAPAWPAIGEVVKHTVFGEGVIIDTIVYGEDHGILVCEFDQVGQKRLAYPKAFELGCVTLG